MRDTNKKIIIENDMTISNNGRRRTLKSYKKLINYQTEYAKKTYRRYLFRLRNDKDIEIINYLNSKDNLNRYIKELIIKDIEKEAR